MDYLSLSFICTPAQKKDRKKDKEIIFEMQIEPSWLDYNHMLGTSKLSLRCQLNKLTIILVSIGW